MKKILRWKYERSRFDWARETLGIAWNDPYVYRKVLRGCNAKIKAYRSVKYLVEYHQLDMPSTNKADLQNWRKAKREAQNILAEIS